MNEKPIIELQSLTYTYPDSNKGIHNISWKVASNQRIALLGLNGAGKSTLSFLLSGVFHPNSGEYILKGKKFHYSKKERKSIGNTVGYIFQDPDVQLFATSVWEDIAFGLRNMKLPLTEITSKVEHYLKLLDIKDLQKTAPHQLSYGQKKLVAIAGVLVMEPEVLILDEPFAWLDNLQQKKMIALLNTLSEQGTTLIVSTHDMEFAFSWSTHALVLDNGKAVAQGDINTLCKQRDTLKALGLNIPDR